MGGEQIVAALEPMSQLNRLVPEFFLNLAAGRELAGELLFLGELPDHFSNNSPALLPAGWFLLGCLVHLGVNGDLRGPGLGDYSAATLDRARSEALEEAVERLVRVIDETPSDWKQTLDEWRREHPAESRLLLGLSGDQVARILEGGHLMQYEE